MYVNTASYKKKTKENSSQFVLRHDRAPVKSNLYNLSTGVITNIIAAKQGLEILLSLNIGISNKQTRS